MWAWAQGALLKPLSLYHRDSEQRHSEGWPRAAPPRRLMDQLWLGGHGA